MNSSSVTKTHFILYVKDQTRSTAFYSQVLGCSPSLNVPGMTEFTFSENSLLGLMPETGIKRLLGEKLPGPVRSTSVPHCEIYLLVSHPLEYHQRAIAAGAVELSGLENRDWGHRAAYSLDPDGYVLAFAEQIESGSEPK
jgi:catechol 2,3-dioxygenase-like lactoylglutathione lyase family enzyme